MGPNIRVEYKIDKKLAVFDLYQTNLPKNSLTLQQKEIDLFFYKERD